MTYALVMIGLDYWKWWSVCVPLSKHFHISKQQLVTVDLTSTENDIMNMALVPQNKKKKIQV